MADAATRSQCGLVEPQVLGGMANAWCSCCGRLQGLAAEPRFVARDTGGRVLGQHDWAAGTGLGPEGAIEFLFGWGREGTLNEHRIVAAGHRVVAWRREVCPTGADRPRCWGAGGPDPARPLHQPHNLAAIRAVAQHARSYRWPASILHSTAPSRRWPRPSPCRDSLSRAYAATGSTACRTSTSPPSCLASTPEQLHGRTVVAHLGNGSLCALRPARASPPRWASPPWTAWSWGLAAGRWTPACFSS